MEWDQHQYFFISFCSKCCCNKIIIVIFFLPSSFLSCLTVLCDWGFVLKYKCPKHLTFSVNSNGKCKVFWTFIWAYSVLLPQQVLCLFMLVFLSLDLVIAFCVCVICGNLSKRLRGKKVFLSLMCQFQILTNYFSYCFLSVSVLSPFETYAQFLFCS